MKRIVKKPVVAKKPLRNLWVIQPAWKNKTAFILCGGTSVTPDMIEALRGLNVIAVNMMYTKAPWAPYLFFHDKRWWNRERAERGKLLAAFPGQIVTTSRVSPGDNLLRLKHIVPPPGIAHSPDTVAMSRTSGQAAINVAYHLGANRIVLVGMDNCNGPEGRAHCHDEYPWYRPKKTWLSKFNVLRHAVEPLAAAGVQVLNASPISALPWWPKVNLFDITEGRI